MYSIYNYVNDNTALFPLMIMDNLFYKVQFVNIWDKALLNYFTIRSANTLNTGFQMPCDISFIT